jgi:carboxyl-terminal processing protease
MRTFTRSFLVTIFAVIALAAAFTGGYLTHAYTGATKGDFPLVDEAYRLVADHGLNPLPSGALLEYGMIRGLLQAYGDPHSIFLEPVQTELESNSLQGSFGGIGVRLGVDEGGFHVLFPFPDSPALEAGILEGDRLVMVGDLAVWPETPLDAIQAAIRGPVGEDVSITITRPPDYLAHDFQVERAEIPLPSVTWHIEPTEARLGVIEVNIIADSTPNEIERAVEDLQRRGATHFVLDLRNNGGGLLNAGIDSARLFLPDGEVIQQQYRGKDVETFRVERAGPLVDIPLAVLVNGGTASAAEIIAGSLQAHERAELVGSITYGKNTIQLVFSLTDHSSMHITAAKWWIPGLDFPTGGKGLAPDILIPDDAQSPQAGVEAVKQLFFSQVQ